MTPPRPKKAKPRPPPMLEPVIRRAIERQLQKLVTADTGEINRWRPRALMSHVAPGVIRSVKRHLGWPANHRIKP